MTPVVFTLAQHGYPITRYPAERSPSFPSSAQTRPSVSVHAKRRALRDFELLVSSVCEGQDDRVRRIDVPHGASHCLTRVRFEQIRPLLEGVRRRTKPRTVDLYEVFCAVLYLLKSGCQ